MCPCVIAGAHSCKTPDFLIESDDMPNSFDKVKEFNETFGAPVRTKPGLDYDDVEMRLGLLVEEVQEIRDAYANYKFLDTVAKVLAETGVDAMVSVEILTKLKQETYVEFLDGLGDVRVVNNGLAQGTGMPINEAFDIIHGSNMSKRQPDGSVLRREDGKILKGEDYYAPTNGLKELLGYM